MIGYYVHHQGEGHALRAISIAAHTTQPVVGLSSRPRPDNWVGDWVQLPRDDDSVPGAPFERDLRDPTGNGRLHWVPYRSLGLTARMAAISSWIALKGPSMLVVDVSVEVAVLARLHGIPVLAVAMPGDRDDEAHRLGYDLAAGILAPWPDRFAPKGWPIRWNDKTHCVGAFSRFDRRSFPPVDPYRGRRRRVVVLGGTGGSYYTRRELAASVAATPTWHWNTLGAGPDWVADPWPILTAADVVITHAGQNAVADVAAARRPAIVIPAERPHHEQEATAASLSRAGLALCCPRWPAPSDWTALLETAVAMDGDRWRLWAPGDGAVKAAAIVDRYAHRVASFR